MIDFIKTDMRNFNKAAQAIIANSDNEALKDLFAGCETVEDVNAAANELIIDLWNDYCERTNMHDRDYYKMDELEEQLRGVEGDILSEDFDKSMPYFTQNKYGKIISVDCLLDGDREELNSVCVKVWEQDIYVYINEDDITEYKTDGLYYEQAYQLDDGRWIAFDEAVNAWVMLG